jgi:hypothetical protein
MNHIVEKQKERAREYLRPKVTIRPEDALRWGNAQHILQSALDEWYKDFEPALDTLIIQTHQQTIAEVVRIAEGMKYKGLIDGPEQGRWVKANNQALTDLIEAITSNKE